MKARVDPTLYYSRKVCIEVSVSLLVPLSASNDTESSNDNYKNLKISGTGLFRDVPVMAISTICEALTYQLEEEKSSFIPVSSLFSHQNLREIIEEYIHLLDMRIQHRETNIKGYVLFSCVLEHINAIQAGLSVEQAIASALNRSLDQCYYTLKTRAMAWGINMSPDIDIDTSGHTQPDDRTLGTHDWLIDDGFVRFAFIPVFVVQVN
ncbi:uncharacterized protein TERG_11728 [Trichophyton rubrum CBS 118892]|uniref:Uncharacterized protein n=1 Tax=Trichophyton rubrum (strain ATCC MYA-4607 / CBS 118892) TaxID=559305 RepID=A0A080WR33_TRIRC|nr:uncharacterized protein TERG_11728 [Trichophyton rubrum CBS 118892]KFL60628.1 hypothetical protein TERG_11728 [Trichophyton rubrum CBS 118892]